MKKERYRIKVIDRDYSEKESLSIIKNMISEGNDFSVIVDTSLDLGLNLSGKEIQDMIEEFNYYKDNISYLEKQSNRRPLRNKQREGRGYRVYHKSYGENNPMYLCKTKKCDFFNRENAIVYNTSEEAIKARNGAIRNGINNYEWKVETL